ncbi:MAG: DUF2027 domain-containing protein [Bacteroidales bacterium]|nr:DUF2027 domain-containing protein [Bacteroidales bacterium]
MNFKKGDKVKFLNENDYGTVTRVMENGIVMVLNSEDFEVPVKNSELILDPSAVKQTEKTEVSAKEVSSFVSKTSSVVEVSKPREADNYGIYLGFVPKDGNGSLQSDLDLYLINDSGFKILYNLMRPSSGSLFSAQSGILEPDTKEYIQTFERENLNTLSSVKIQLLYSMDTPFSVKPPEEYDIKISAQKFFALNYYKTNDFFDEKAVIITVKESSLMKEAVDKLKVNDFQNVEPKKAINKKPQKTLEKEVVDLHLTELLEDDRGLSPKEKLDYQMKVFKEKLEEYIKNPHVKKVIFIHGKGNGTLKTEIRRCLELNYRRYQYQDASFEEYGGGATLVYVK